MRALSIALLVALGAASAGCRGCESPRATHDLSAEEWDRLRKKTNTYWGLNIEDSPFED